MSNALTRAARIRGAVVGLLVGDALGVPYEFHGPDSLPPADQIEMQPPPGFQRSHGGVPPGTWSDDGAQALCLLASLLFCGRLDLDDFARRLLNWRDHGYMAVDGVVFDVGMTTEQAFGQLRAGVPAASAGPASVYANGNGALMRVLPLALWHQGGDAQLIDDAQRSSLVTHGHIRSQVCCALYCLWARYILRGVPDPWDAAVAALRRYYPAAGAARIELDEVILGSAAGLCGGSGYVVDCLHSARWANDQGGFEQAVKSAIALGNDTDTTACVAGGIAGLSLGIEAIPGRWRRELRGMEEVEPLLAKLVG